MRPPSGRPKSRHESDKTWLFWGLSKIKYFSKHQYQNESHYSFYFDPPDYSSLKPGFLLMFMNNIFTFLTLISLDFQDSYPQLPINPLRSRFIYTNHSLRIFRLRIYIPFFWQYSIWKSIFLVRSIFQFQNFSNICRFSDIPIQTMSIYFLMIFFGDPLCKNKLQDPEFQLFVILLRS